MLQVCIYRNSVRRALKSIAQALEQLELSQSGAAETAQVAQAVMTVVSQIAQSLHRLQMVSLGYLCLTAQQCCSALSRLDPQAAKAVAREHPLNAPSLHGLQLASWVR